VALTVKPNVDAAIKGYFNPTTWGSGQGGTNVWQQTTYARYLELAAAINAATGVDYITSLTFGMAGGAQGTTDILLPGVAPLATIDNAHITGTVNAP
jgi:hypothetical protein